MTRLKVGSSNNETSSRHEVFAIDFASSDMNRDAELACHEFQTVHHQIIYTK